MPASELKFRPHVRAWLSWSERWIVNVGLFPSKTENSNSHEFELYRPSIKNIKLMLKAIKARINIDHARKCFETIARLKPAACRRLERAFSINMSGPVSKWLSACKAIAARLSLRRHNISTISASDCQPCPSQSSIQ